MKTELIIFDLDGTLINSVPDLTDSLNQVANFYNKSMFTQTSITNIVGGGIKKLVENAFNINPNESKFNDYFNKFLEHYEHNFSNGSHLYNNVLEILEYYKSKKLAILSNKSNYLTKQIVIDYKIDSYFNLILGATNELEKKPSAQPVFYILKNLNVDPSNAILVGDSEPDIICAKNAGIVSIALTSGYRSKSQLEPLNPDYIIDDIMDLKSIIKL